MRNGDYVRKCMGDGTPVGSYYQVIGYKNNYQLVHLQSLVSETERTYIRRNRIYLPRQMKIIISHAIFDKIEHDRQHSIIHDPSPRWKEMLSKQPELIQMRDEIYEEKIMIFEVDAVKMTAYRAVLGRKNGFQIRLDLANRIL